MNATATPDENNFPSSPVDSVTVSESVGNARAQLHETVAARKEAQKDVQLLLNRIKLLKTEESKALRCAEITRSRANRLADLKSSFASREVERRQVLQFKEMQAAANHERNQYLRDVAKVSRENSRKQLEQSKLQAAYETRKALRKQIQERLVSEKAERERTQIRTETIKQERLASRKRLETERIERLKAFHREYETKMADEQRKKEESEALIAKLELEEMELIQRLQKAQEVQSQVLEDLGNVTSPLPQSPGTTASNSMVSSRMRKSRNVAAPSLVTLRRADLGGAAMR